MWEVDEKNIAYNDLISFPERKLIQQKIAYIEKIALEIGFSEKQSKILYKIAERRRILYETFLALKDSKKDYKKVLDQYKQMIDDPTSFYQKNKKIKNLENDVLTYGSLSLSYSFCSPIILISEIVNDARNIKGYHEYMVETFDDAHKIEEFELFNQRETNRLKRKYQSLIQDLKGNKVPKDLILSLTEKLEFDKRDDDIDTYMGRYTITKPVLIDAFYIFFGSKLGSDFVDRWKSAEDKESLKQEFEDYIYENPYINSGLVDMKLEDFGTKEYLKSVQRFLEECKEIPKRTVEQDFGLRE